ncbi:MAG: TetR/AcrR family transcriptional regulator [Nocardioides sp.]
MGEAVKTRRYRSALREQQAARTRRAVLTAARDLFGEQGYAGTAVGQVADRAGVSVDTVYTSVGRKPELLLGVLDTVLAGGEEPVPAEERDYVRAIRAAASAEEKLRIYAHALAGLLPRTAPLLEALRDAARTDEGCAQVWRQVNERRAANMLLLAEDLRATGRLREDLTDQEVADVLWSTNAVEYFGLLSSRGWDGPRVGALLEDLWTRLLLA